jgi:flavin-dependent dehydrogenase
LNLRADLVVIGAGPAGIATAIAASAKGLQSIVVDAQTPPIDKPCGEGLLPHGVAALRALGIRLNADIAVPFRGIRFVDRNSFACAKFSDEIGFALRRVRLHHLLLDHATRVGVTFLWGTWVTDIQPDSIFVGTNRIRYRWLVGADGLNSIVRKWANLSSQTLTQRRFGFRRHFQVRPWTDVVEVYWGEGCQVIVTPTGEEEVGVAVFSRDPRLRLAQALPMFSSLAGKLQGAVATSKETGNVTSLTRVAAVTRGRVALVGDASGTVDAITGHGLSLSFQQALHLAEAFEQGNLARYISAHRKIAAMPAMMTRLMLLMENYDWICRRALRLFQHKPMLFSKLLSIHAGEVPLSSIRARDMADFGWKFLWA